MGAGQDRYGPRLLAVLDGLDGREAVAYVREHYDRRAVAPWQHRYATRFANK